MNLPFVFYNNNVITQLKGTTASLVNRLQRKLHFCPFFRRRCNKSLIIGGEETSARLFTGTVVDLSLESRKCPDTCPSIPYKYHVKSTKVQGEDKWALSVHQSLILLAWSRNPVEHLLEMQRFRNLYRPEVRVFSGAHRTNQFALAATIPHTHRHTQLVDFPLYNW